ncbi:hypothetical protein AOB60_39020 [Streptomyces noursei]|uniref:Uncharacterized protein n=1 Tax=Streptomyces noursei TaxID=1971 RepID=A0A2N8P518_STRNR|nr:hypothetical protein AOB60_39020 [Streptomyces noursei]
MGGPALRPVPAAAAIAPTRPPVPRTLGGFDFFGNTTVPRQQLTARLEEDLADVVGDEAVAEQSARAEARAALPPAAGATTAAALPESEAVESDATEPAAAEHDTAAGADGEASGEEAPGKTVADGATTHGAGEVIDLTAHDETEQLDLAELRSAIS